MSNLNNCIRPSFTWGGVNKSFDDIDEARSFVRNNKLEIVLGLSQDIMYELKGATETQKKVEGLFEAVKSKINKSKGRYTLENKYVIGTTKAIVNYRTPTGSNRGKRVVNEFNQEAYEANFKTEYIRNETAALGPNPTNEQLKKIKAEAEYEWGLNLDGIDFKRKAGTTEHLIAEAFFNSTDGISIEEVKKISSDNAKVDAKNGTLTDGACQDYLNGLNDFKGYLSTKYEDPIFLTEQQIAQLSPDIHQLLEESKDAEGVMGIIDLLVIDKNGKIGIYDFKTSVKAASFWSKDKKQGAAMQQLIYKQIVKNIGIPEADIIEVGLVPIHFSSVDIDKKEIQRISFGRENDIILRVDQGGLLEPHHIAAVTQLAPFKDTTALSVETEGSKTSDLIHDLFEYEVKTSSRLRELDKEFEKLLNSEDSRVTGKFYYYTSAKSEVLTVDKSKPDWKETLKKDLEKILEVENEIYRLFPKRAIKFFKDWRAYNDNLTETQPTFVSYGSVTTDDKLYATMQAYIDNPEWSIVEDNESANELGIIIFYNSTSNTYNFLNFTTNRIKDNLYTDSPGTTLLGSLMSDSQATVLGLDKNASIQDLEMLKVYAFIQFNKSTFGRANIGAIKTIQTDMLGDVKNMWSQFNHELDRQWRIISKQTAFMPDGYIAWTPKFDNHAQSLIYYINTMSKKTVQAITKNNMKLKEALNLFNNKSSKLKYLEENLEFAEQLLIALYRAKQIKNSAVGDESNDLILQLSSYIAEIKNLRLKNQKDWDSVGDLFGSRNTKYTASSQIGHSYAQELRTISSAVLDNTRKRLTEKLTSAKAAFKRLYGMTSGPSIGGFSYGTKFFTPLLELGTNGAFNGNIIRETTPGLTATQVNFIKEFTDMIKALRVEYYMEVDGVNKSVAESTAEMFRYQLPIMKSGIMTLLADGNKRDWFKKYSEYVYNPEYFQETDDDKKAMSNAILEVRSAFAHTEPSLTNNTAREEAIAKMVEERSMEKDLETVFAMFAMTTVKSVELNKRKTELTIIQAMAHMNEMLMHNDIPNISEWVDSYISYALLGKRDVEAGSKKSEIILRTASQLASTMKMTFKPMALITEHVQGMSNILSKLISTRLANDDYTFTQKELGQAVSFLMSESISSDRIFADLVDRLFRFATNSNYELIEKFMVGRRGGKRVSYWSYIGYSAPDFNNRVSIALAQMIKDGVLILDGNDIASNSPLQVANNMLVYNPRLDKRFSVYLANPNQTNPSETWIKQKAQYEARVVDMRTHNPDGLTASGELANPYTPREMQNLRTFGNKLFGYYSDEDKMVAARFGITRLFMQFKTWAIPKLQKWYKTSSQIDQGRYNYVMDENGAIIGAEWVYSYTEGALQTFYQLMRESKFDFPAYITNWKKLSPDQKENVYSALIDALIGFILASLFKAASEALSDADAPSIAVMSSQAALKGVSDLNILDVASAMVGSGSGGPIAVVGIASDLYLKTTEMITNMSPKTIDSFLSTMAVYKQTKDIVGYTVDAVN